MIILDKTQKFLSEYIEETEAIMNDCLRQYDNNAHVKLTPSIDIGFPHDVIRIAGGFPTGMHVQWKSEIPFIPIDTTVNVCSTSIFEIDISIDIHFLQEQLSKLNDIKSCFELNFHRGNHFISVIKSQVSNKKYLVLHSSALEFRDGYYGLYPSPNSWYDKNIKIFYSKNRYLRYIIGEDASIFYNIAKNIDIYNLSRHNFFANILTKGNLDFSKSHTMHHYGMPTKTSIVIGSYLVDIGECFAILTKPGAMILYIKINKVKDESLLVGNKILVPHGWGKMSNIAPTIRFEDAFRKILINENPYLNEYGISAGKDMTLQTREYSIDEYCKLLSNYFEYEIVDYYQQLFSYNKAGYKEWNE